MSYRRSVYQGVTNHRLRLVATAQLEMRRLRTPWAGRALQFPDVNSSWRPLANERLQNLRGLGAAFAARQSLFVTIKHRQLNVVHGGLHQFTDRRPLAAGR